MERLTDRKTAADLASNYAGLRAAGQPRDIETERYIKLAAFEDQEEKRHGRWIDGWICSECSSANPEPNKPFCPNCGAKMDGGEKK